MGDVASEAKLLDPRNRAKVEQSIRLVFKGKEGAAGQDPALRPFVNALILKGATSAENINQRLQAQKQQEARIAAAKRVETAKLTRGDVLGFSGTGLTPSEMAKRDLLIKTGIVKQVSTKDPFAGVDPLTKKFYIQKTPSKKQQQDFIRTLKAQRFDTTPRFQNLNKVEKAVKRINNRIQQLRNAKTQSQRQKLEGQIKKDKKGLIATIKKTGKFTTRQAEMFGLGLSASVLGFVGSLPRLPGAAVGFAKKTPAGVKTIINEPGVVVSTTKTFSSKMIKKGKAFGKLIVVEPGLAVGKIAGEVFILKGTGKAFKVVGKVGGNAAARLSPKFRKIKGGTIKIPSQRPGKTLKITVGGPVAKIREPISKQAAVAGTRTTAVSAQADRLVNMIRTRKVVRKPIPNEKLLRPTTKKLLKKFDDGKITSREFTTLNKAIQKETKGAANLLERSFFADPKGRFRPSRLGLRKERDASIKDILKGDFTFKSGKPQILIFEDVAIEKFPASLRGVAKKLKSGKSLTKSEADQLLKFQSKISGKFKPVGALTREPEITLAPGEVIKKVKKVGVTTIKGKKVDIVKVKVVKPTKKTQTLLKKSKAGTITSKELKELRKRINKETGFKSTLSRRTTRRKPRARLPKPIPRRKPIGRRKVRIPKKIGVRKMPIRKRTRPIRPRKIIRKPIRPRRIKKTGRPIPRKSTRKTPPKTTPRPPARRGRPGKPVKKPPARPPRRGGKPSAIPPKKVGKTKRIRVRKQKPGAYNVFARPLKATKKGAKPKLIKINKRKLSKTRAKDLRNYVTDTSLARTARIKKTKGKPGQPKLKVPTGYSRKTSKKFRRYKVIKGKRQPLPKGKVIERSRNLLDTRQEKKKITLRRRIKQLSKPLKRRVPIKKPKVSRAVMLANLAKARRVRVANLKKRGR